MNIDLGSFAFGSTILNSSGTPSWGTALGQSSPEYKMTYDGVERIIMGLAYNIVPKKYIKMPIGKGGHVYSGEEKEEIQLAGLFRNVYVNGVHIGYPFIIVLQKENSNSHPGRRSIKYSDKIIYSDGSEEFHNEVFIQKIREKFGIATDGCWFAYDIDIQDQDILHIRIMIVNKEEKTEYNSAEDRKRIWQKLIADGNNSIPDSTNLHGSPLQTIYFGSPGTGKSYIIQSKILKGVPDEHIFRTTFHPDSDYSSFVGCYKPQMKDGNIRYDFAPQVFTKAYCKAWKNPSTPVYLIIEEINRGNCAQIFGDLFQLLDRRNGVSEYPVDADSDLGNFLADDLKNFAENECDGSRGIENGKLCLPANLNIVATMNTSDQSLFPMDSAFKRRWDWRFIPTSPAQKADRLLEYSIEDGAVSADGRIINAGDYEYSWKEFLEKINRKILLATRSEDKQIGFWFTKTDSDGRISISDFVSKVVFYLWNDVFKDMGAKDGNPFTVKIDGKNTLLPYNSFFEENFEGEIVECLGVVHTFLINVGLMPIQPAAMKSEVTHPASAPQENAGSE